MSQYAVTVIALTHNQEKYIDKVVSSVISQDFSLPYELIIVNDSSSDGTAKKLEKIIAENDNTRVLSVDFGAASLSRIAGIKEAKGKYITFLDGDDYYHPEMLKKLYSAITKNDADLANCSHFYVRKRRITKDLWRKKKTMNQVETFDAFFKDSFFRGFMCTKMFKAEVLKNVEFTVPFAHIMFEDVIMSFNIISKCEKAVSIRDRLFYYNKANEQSATKTNNKRSQAHLNAFALQRYLIDVNKNEAILKAWRKQHIRRKLSLLVDFYFERKTPNKKDHRKLIFKELKMLNSKEPIAIENHSFENFIASAIAKK